MKKEYILRRKRERKNVARSSHIRQDIAGLSVYSVNKSRLTCMKSPHIKKN